MLGLNRDGSSPSDSAINPLQKEFRRRLWAYLYHDDRWLALILGKPPCINDAFCDTPLPLNVDDSTLLSHSFHPSHTLPLSQPTMMTGLILRTQLCAIIGRFIYHLQKAPSAKSSSPAEEYAEVKALDSELDQFIANLPRHYAIDNPDTSLDNDPRYSSFITLHRYIVATQTLMARIALHRPYILRHLQDSASVSEMYAFSRTACFESVT